MKKADALCEDVVAANRRQVTVEVTILSDQGKGDFKLSSPAGPKHVPIANDYVVTFDNKQDGKYHDGFEVKFALANDALSSMYKFATPLDDALWVKVLDNKGPCPANKNGNPGGLFDPVRFEDQGRSLVVENPNSTAQFFGFALRFEQIGGGGPKLTYDPIGNNQNGNFA